jgi:hypothetical protein
VGKLLAANTCSFEVHLTSPQNNLNDKSVEIELQKYALCIHWYMPDFREIICWIFLIAKAF